MHKLIKWLKKPSGEFTACGNQLTNFEVMISDVIVSIMLGITSGIIFGYFRMMIWR